MKLTCLVTLLVPLVFGQFPQVHHSYNDGYAEAVRTGKPLVVHIGHRPLFDVPNTITAIAASLDEYPDRCIAVSYPKDGSLYWKATLPMSASRDDVLKCLREEVKPVAVAPFQLQQRITPARTASNC